MIRYMQAGVLCILLLGVARGGQALEIKTSDGLSLELADRTGQVEAILVDGRPIPLLGAALPVRMREFLPTALHNDLVPNPGIEDGAGAPDSWPELGNGCARTTEFNHTPGGKYCGKVSAPQGASESAPASSGQFKSAVLSAKPSTQYVLRAWGLVPKGSSGGNVFVVELDAQGQIIWKDKFHVQHSLGWRPPASDDWSQKETSFTTGPNCAKFHIYANIWKGYGTFYFDDVELVDVSACWKDLALTAGPVEGVEDGKSWRQRISAHEDNLDLEVKYSAQRDHIRMDVSLQDTHTPVKERVLEVRYVLPINTVGWTWHDDGRRGRTVAAGESSYDNAFDTAGGRISSYPFTSVTEGKTGLSLGAPMDRPRVQNFLYAPSQGYLTTVDLGLSPLTRKIGEGKADFTAILFSHDGEWGMRSAAKKYYEIYPEFFKKRAKREGMWFYVAPPRSIPSIEDFGLVFYEGGPLKPEDTAFAHEKGIYILPYTEPWGVRQGFPKVEAREQMPPYEERLAILKQWAADKESKQKLLGGRGPQWEVAQAVLNSMPYERTGLAPFHVDKYGMWAQWWMTNTNPGLPQPSRWSVCKQYEIDPVIAQADGMYLDSVTFMLGSYLNHREEHFASAEIPLTFDPVTGRPALLGIFSHCEFMEWIAGELHGQGKLVQMNIFANTYRFCAHLGDVLGSEVSSAWGGKKRDLSDVESDETSLLRRMLAYHKPTSNLLQEGNYHKPAPERSQADIEQYIKHQMFYGFFPGIATIGGEEKAGYKGWKRYFGTPAQYERDRPLFKKYIPIIRELCAAGWEPVTGARTSEADVLIERFGSWEENNLHFSLRNAGEKAASFSVLVEAPPGTEAAARELVSGAEIAGKANEKTGALEYIMTLPPKETAVLRIERRRGRP